MRHSLRNTGLHWRGRGDPRFSWRFHVIANYDDWYGNMKYRGRFVDKNWCSSRGTRTIVEQQEWTALITDGHFNAILRISTPEIKPTINKLVDAVQTQK